MPENNEHQETDILNDDLNMNTESAEKINSSSEDSENNVEGNADHTIIEELTQKNEELEDRVLRLQAEIANIQRRQTKVRQDAAKYRSQSLATSLLDALDNLERALSTEVTSEDAKSLHKGIEMVLEQFQKAFQDEHIDIVDPIGEPFDPEYHQAVTMQAGEEGQPSHTVLQVLQKGYILNGRVIRPAMVIVSE